MSRDPMRVLHVHSHLARGGVETWLARVVQLLDPVRYRFDFAVHQVDQDVADSVRAYGSVIHRTGLPRNVASYWQEIVRIAQQGKYDMMHCHFFEHAGYAMLAGKLAGVPVRIAHSHLEIAPLLPSCSMPWKLYWAFSRRLVLQYATAGVAVSAAAGRAMFGENWREDSRWLSLPCGIDLSPFRGVRQSPVRQEVRRRLGIADNAYVIGHVGRFVDQKNQKFLIPLLRKTVDDGLNAVLLLVGDGPMEVDVRRAAAAAGVAERVHFYGTTSKVAAPLAAMDLFAFPSLYEGLGLAVVEAQASSLSCLLSENIPREADVVQNLCTRVPLADPRGWAAAVRSASQRETTSQADANWQRVAASVFEIQSNTEALLAFYERAMFRARTKDRCA